MAEEEQKFDEATLNEKRNEFKAKMEAYKNEFYKNYQKPKGSINQRFTAQDLISNELNILSNKNRDKLEDTTTVYNDKLIQTNLDNIPGEQVLFQPELQGLSKVYTLVSSEAIAQLNKRASFLKQTQETKMAEGVFTGRNFAKEIDSLLEASKKQVSATQTVIDINRDAGFKLLVTIAEFFDTGLNGSARNVFDSLSEIPTNNVALQSSIIYAHSNNNHKKNVRFLVRFVYVMLVNLQCSNLIRTLNMDNDFLRTHYFFDAPIRDPVIAEIIASRIEQIECFQIEGDVNEKRSKDFTPPVEGKLFAKRVEETVDQYLNSMRLWLLEDVNIGRGQLNQLHLPQLVVIFNLFAQTFLTQETGEVASIGSLWDVFKNISQAEISGSKFQKFKNILKMKEVTASLNTTTRTWHALVEIYNAKILPDIPVWGSSSKGVRSVKNPVYAHDAETCRLVSNGLKPFYYPNISVDYDELMEYVG